MTQWKMIMITTLRICGSLCNHGFFGGGGLIFTPVSENNVSEKREICPSLINSVTCYFFRGQIWKQEATGHPEVKLKATITT